MFLHTLQCYRDRAADARILPCTPDDVSAISIDVWVAVEDLKLSYHNSETTLFTIYPSHENLN